MLNAAALDRLLVSIEVAANVNGELSILHDINHTVVEVLEPAGENRRYRAVLEERDWLNHDRPLREVQIHPLPNI